MLRTARLTATTRAAATRTAGLVRNASSSSAGASSTLRNTLSAVALIVSGTAVTAYYLDSRSALHRYAIPPLLRASLDAEQAHRFAVNALASGLAPKDLFSDDASLQTEIWGHKLSNPISLAAGFDKDAEAIEGMFSELCYLVASLWRSQAYSALASAGSK